MDRRRYDGASAALAGLSACVDVAADPPHAASSNVAAAPAANLRTTNPLIDTLTPRTRPRFPKRGAYAELLARHQAVAFRAAYLIAGSAAEAEDATQEACVKARLALERFRPGAPFRPWLVHIAMNEARNRRRAAGRRAGLTLRLNPEFADYGSVPSAESVALEGEDRAQLAAVVARLREDDQLIIAARYFLGLSEARQQ